MSNDHAALVARLTDSLRSGLLFDNLDEPLDAYGKRIVRVVLAALTASEGVQPHDPCLIDTDPERGQTCLEAGGDRESWCRRCLVNAGRLAASEGVQATGEAQRVPAGDDRCGCWDRQAFHRTVGMLPGEICINKGGSDGLPKLRTTDERARDEGTGGLQRLPEVAPAAVREPEPSEALDLEFSARLNAAEIEAIIRAALARVKGQR
jgi:hypothetical protein